MKRGENIPFSFHSLSPGLNGGEKKESSVNACLLRVTHEVCRTLKVCKYVRVLKISPSSCRRGPQRSLGCPGTYRCRRISFSPRQASIFATPSLSLLHALSSRSSVGGGRRACREISPSPLVRDLSSFRVEEVFFSPN